MDSAALSDVHSGVPFTASNSKFGTKLVMENLEQASEDDYVEWTSTVKALAPLNFRNLLRLHN